MDIGIFAVFLVAAGCAAATGAFFPAGAWYRGLTKPAWVPPNWVFPVVWTTLYLLMAIAGARVAGAEAAAPGAVGAALGFWALQIAANALWTPVFFGLRHMRAALAIMALLWLAVLGALVTHWRVDLWAGLAFVPYLAWVSVAAALNLSLLRLNPGVAPLRLSDL